MFKRKDKKEKLNRREEIKEELENLEVQTRRREKIKKEIVDFKWISRLVFISFLITLGLAFVSETTVPKFNLWVGVIINLIFVVIGVIFDVVGISVTTADEKIFHSMNSRRVPGAAVAVKLKKNSEKVSTFCCDVIGDICGVISGSTALPIALFITNMCGANKLLVTLLVTGVISGLTIFGKAVGKCYAINKCDIILYKFAKILSIFYKCK